MEDADRAVKLNNWITRRMLKKAGLHVSENEQDSKYKKLLRLIHSKTDWSLNQLTRATTWLQNRERRELLESMVIGDHITQEIKATGGRPVTIIRST